MLASAEEFDRWLRGSADAVFALAQQYASKMRRVQERLKEGRFRVAWDSTARQTRADEDVIRVGLVGIDLDDYLVSMASCSPVRGRAPALPPLRGAWRERSSLPLSPYPCDICKVGRYLVPSAAPGPATSALGTSRVKPTEALSTRLGLLRSQSRGRRSLASATRRLPLLTTPLSLSEGQ